MAATITPLDRSSKARRVHTSTWQRIASIADDERRPTIDQLDVLVHEALTARGLPGLYEDTPTQATG